MKPATKGAFSRWTPLLLLVLWLAVYPVVISDVSLLVVPVALSGLGMVVVGTTIGRLPPAYAGVGLLFVAYLLALVIRDVGVDLGAPVIGVVGYLSIECIEICAPRRVTGRVSHPTVLRRASFVTAAVGAGAAVAVAALWAGAVSRVTGPTAMGVAAVAALAALWLLVGAAHRSQ